MIRVELPTVHCESPPEMVANLPEKAGDFRLGRYRFTQGPQTGCELLLVDFGRGRVAICPTRGMSLWRAQLDGVPCEWRSPVRGPVHPSLVRLDDPSGIGWLDGFDELLVRCGLQSFGAPDFDSHGRLLHPLHGKIGNTPAENLQIELDAQRSVLLIRADVYETRFLVGSLRLSVEYQLTYDQPMVGIRDQVTNLSSCPTSMQLLYHINFGQPLLEENAQLFVATEQVVARDLRAAEGLDSWHTYPPPTSGYAEQVYFLKPLPDDRGWASAVLAGAGGQGGVHLRFQTGSLPYFTQWKNCAASQDGYVTGLEPATGFPNPRSFEQQQGRLVPLQAGQSVQFEIQLEGTRQPERLADWIDQIKKLQAELPPSLVPGRPDWCR
jgi:galactose mutarotase-like enzyme